MSTQCNKEGLQEKLLTSVREFVICSSDCVYTHTQAYSVVERQSQLLRLHLGNAMEWNFEGGENSKNELTLYSMHSTMSELSCLLMPVSCIIKNKRHLF